MAASRFGHLRTIAAAFGLAAATAAAALTAQTPAAALDEELMRHYQAVLRVDSTDPPGNETGVVDYLKGVLDKEGIAYEVFALEPNRPNLVARLKGNGKKKPLLLMAHTDTVNVDPAKWQFPPFSATRDGGYVYGRGAVDNKQDVATGLMTLLRLKREKVALDRDVIFLAEAGEEGTTRVGILHMANTHFPAIDAEYCLAEGGGVSRVGGKVKYASVETTEKIPRAIELTARGPAGHGSVPLENNALTHLSSAVAAAATWVPPISLNETTAAYFKRLASISTPEEAARYRDVLSPDPKVSGAADAYFRRNEPIHASMLRSSISPTIVQAGYRVNVIPSEVKATLDVRTLPDQDPDQFLELVKKVVNDPAVEVKWAARDVRPGAPPARLESEVFRAIETNVTKHYEAIVLPTLLTGATDMAYLRAKGMQCYGIGPALDVEDQTRGFGAHSDQERILESELHRYARFYFDVVRDVAGTRP
ncbi:MAG: M20/M25/M40 family metallo-hydrolase [Acidobacteria bacterium]|nr:M20/M25/M40 family metallo-hydrolase [Acidobacteriota bacterium]